MLEKNVATQELKEELHKQLESLDQDQLIQVYGFIAKMIGQKLIGAMEEENLSEKRIRDAVSQHRKKYPYGSNHT